MAKENFDITRITLNVYSLENSETIMQFSDAELGQWLRLFCKAVSIAKECSLPDDRKLLSKFVSSNLSSRVLDAFPVICDGPLAGRRRNDVQYAAWCSMRGRSETATVSASARYEPDPRTKPLHSTNAVCERSVNAVQSDSERTANRTEHNITKQDSTKQQSVGDVFDEVAGTTPPATGEDHNGRKKGWPGYYERGQYPGTDPKKVFRHMQKVWSDVKGEAAHIRYPSKFPETWEGLCDDKSADLIVPAFELWCEKQGRYMNTAWPVSEFLKESTEYMALIKPLTGARPKMTPEISAATDVLAAKRRAEFFDVPATVEVEPDANAFLEEK